MRLVVTTWNLQGSKGVDAEAVAAHVREQGSDLLLLQEVQRRQARRLARILDARSVSWAFKHWPVKIPAEGMAVVGLRVPARARATAVTQRFRWWNWRRRIVQLAHVPLDPDAEQGGRLTVVNVHLSPHGAATARENELATIGRLLDGDGGEAGDGDEGGAGPTMVAGDFNDLPDSSVAVQLKGAGLRDAWADAHPDGVDRGATNWSGVPRRGPPSQRIDYVWVSAGVEVVDAQVPAHGDVGFERYPVLSDHLPLTVTLDVAPDPRR